MNEPRYQDVSADENVNGTTLRAWVDEMGAFVKGIDPNHLLGTGLEGHETTYGFGGNEGNPFVYIHQSPYIDFTSATRTRPRAGRTCASTQTKTLIRRLDQRLARRGRQAVLHGRVQRPQRRPDRLVAAIYTDFEAAGGDGSAFWWYPATNVDGKFGVMRGAPELASFRTHSANMIAKSGGVVPSLGLREPVRSPCASSRPPLPPSSAPVSASASSPPPARPCTVHYGLSDWGSSFNGDVTIRNTGTAAITGWALRWTFPATRSRRSTDPMLSPDDRNVAFTVIGAVEAIWIYDFARRTVTSLTSTAAGKSQAPTWSPDGSQIIYRGTRGGFRNLFRKAVDGGGDEERLTTADSLQTPTSWSVDGKHLIFVDTTVGTGPDSAVLDTDTHEPRVFLRTAAGETNPRFSPDGRAVAYV